jgi:hypothetical protein
MAQIMYNKSATKKINHNFKATVFAIFGEQMLLSINTNMKPEAIQKWNQ